MKIRQRGQDLSKYAYLVQSFPPVLKFDIRKIKTQTAYNHTSIGIGKGKRPSRRYLRLFS